MAGVGLGRVVLTADQVLHDGDVVSRSGGFGTTATRTPDWYHEHHFLDEWVKAGLDYLFYRNYFIRRRELNDFNRYTIVTVSYTHLTLPTKRIV